MPENALQGCAPLSRLSASFLSFLNSNFGFSVAKAQRLLLKRAELFGPQCLYR